MTLLRMNTRVKKFENEMKLLLLVINERRLNEYTERQRKQEVRDIREIK